MRDSDEQTLGGKVRILSRKPLCHDFPWSSTTLFCRGLEIRVSLSFLHWILGLTFFSSCCEWKGNQEIGRGEKKQTFSHCNPTFSCPTLAVESASSSSLHRPSRPRRNARLLIADCHEGCTRCFFSSKFCSPGMPGKSPLAQMKDQILLESWCKEELTRNLLNPKLRPLECNCSTSQLCSAVHKVAELAWVRST